MSKNQQEIIDILNNKENLNAQEKLHNSWITNLKSKYNTPDDQAHWGTLGKFLKENNIIMFNRNNETYNFSQDIVAYEKACVRAKKSDREKNWFENSLKAYERLVKEGDIGTKAKGHNKHVHTVIWSMLDDGYSFKAKASAEKIIFVKESELPSCQELIVLAEEIKEKRGNEPAPDAIFDLWQALNENRQLDDNVREKLCYKCFTALT